MEISINGILPLQIFKMQIGVKIKLRLSIQIGHGAGTGEIENFCNFIISNNFVVLMNING